MECCVTLRLAEIPVAIPFQLRKGIGRSVANLSLDLSSHETPLVRCRYSGRGHDFGTSFDLPEENWVRFAEKHWAAIAGFEISRAAQSARVMAGSVSDELVGARVTLRAEPWCVSSTVH